MSKKGWVKPHGGKLIDLVVDAERGALLKEIAMNLSDITLNERQMCDLELLASGAFSPLEGYMVRADYESVLDRMRLQQGTLWPVPICLDVSETQGPNLEAGQSVALRDPEGYLLAVLHIADIWPVEHQKEAEVVYRTCDTAHPGVAHLLGKVGAYYIGGGLEVISPPLHFDFKQLRLSPIEVRRVYKKLGWQRVVGFQTRQPIHRPQFEVTIRAMRQAQANLLILPVAGMIQPGDFDHFTRMRCYRGVSRHYPPDSFITSLLTLAKRLSGPRDAVLDMIIAKNYGCTHFIIGHDHSSPDLEGTDESFYHNKDIRQVAEECGAEIGIEVVSFEQMVYLPFEDEYRPRGHVPDDVQCLTLSGSDIRKRIRTGRKIPDWATFPEVVGELLKAYPPPARQGFAVFFTGLSGAGKSTVAQVLHAKVLEMGERPVTLLDGDIVRHNLSSNLGFTKEDRDINVRRIGFVASEITKNRGIAICAPIAPYARTRREIRQAIEEYGGFIEVHVATPIEVCEKRDRKGMYAKARAGLIKGFTGVDDPYEVPENAEVSIDTSNLTPDEAAQEILLFLGQKGFI